MVYCRLPLRCLTDHEAASRALRLCAGEVDVGLVKAPSSLLPTALDILSLLSQYDMSQHHARVSQRREIDYFKDRKKLDKLL